MAAEVVLYTRAGCPLCDEAAAALERLRPALGFTLVTRDVDAEAVLTEAYGDRVPVVAVGERELAWGEIDPAALQASLRGALRAS